jgi:class 3 adenylate cyclase
MVIGAFHRCCATVIERAGGSGAKYMGAGELAHFGHPRADEHHAERAVPAGLALVQAAAGLTPRRGTRKRLLPAAKRRAKSGYYEKTMARSGGRCRPSALST